MAKQLDEQTAEKLIEGDLPWEELRTSILPDPKDPNRFQVVREVLQNRVDWDEPILVPLTDHLYAVGTDDGRKVKAECGHELCDLGENWKHHCRVRVREGREDMMDLYTHDQSPDPDWQFQLRELFCPECYTLVDVEAAPVGYPIQLPFEPDIDLFYESWLDETPPDRE